MVPFSRRELRNAWAHAYRVSQSMPRSNAHRLLLFYAIECGLKAVWPKRQNQEILEKGIINQKTGAAVKHDINGMLDNLLAGQELKLPSPLRLRSLRRSGGQADLVRDCEVGDLNQAWRYGGALLPPNDDTSLEQALESVHTWLVTELR